MQRLAEELLGHARAVGVRGVEQVDTELDGAAQHGDGGFPVCGRSPYSGTGELHGSEAEAVHDAAFVAAEPEAAGTDGRAGVGRDEHGATIAPAGLVRRT